MKRNGFGRLVVLLAGVMALFSSQALLAAGTELNVIAAYNAKQDIFDAFSKATGIKVNQLDMSSGEVLARMRAEKGRPLADVWFGGGVDAFIAAKKDGLLEPYVSPQAANIDAKYKDAEGYWTGISLVTVDFVVNTQILKERGIPIPETWEALTAPAFKGEISMSDPSISGTAYFTLYSLLAARGKEKGWEFFAKLAENIPFYAKRGSEPPQRAAMGESLVGLAPGLWPELQAQGYPIQYVFPKDGIPWWPAPVAIFKDAEHMEAAKALVDWALSKEGQEVLKTKDPRFPTRADVAPPEALAGVDTTTFIPMDFLTAGAERAEVLKTWQERFAK
ncbi:ABC transporter substrate-binding protein [Desulfovibrio sulfodismutans]|uniref:ABC transporter substrate-binding protein n=1 Tax=Desulfolutivibrio sulfodismutans TaxID=63561 RepID=A0A7K3NGB3_9BACT|nr:ABC transporter substrate-binding protein [Desulfolutivibrio sulfodismutans]NDY55226.1 ABC transporter substrate-binding protein [Desulfolutivibrio sulfodismutans]QLA12962.1 extracellular solute-binding protein [Desulfolutivibrio sulfodismutans DSM 3696]